LVFTSLITTTHSLQ